MMAMDSCDFDVESGSFDLESCDFQTEEIAVLCRKFDTRLAIFRAVVGEGFIPGTMTMAEYLSTDTRYEEGENEGGD
jgi:hypothetical protein